MIDPNEFDKIFDEIIELSQRTEDAAVRGRLLAASDLIGAAENMHKIIRENGFDLKAIGLQEDRNKERRQGERRLTR
jgi:Ribonuclease G/E